MRSVGVQEVAGMVGHSVGELGCAYADGCLTAEQTVLTAYWRGTAVQEACLPPGAMAAVGKLLISVVGSRLSHWLQCKLCSSSSVDN